MKIKRISSREILDSRGNPTVCSSVELTDGVIVEASVPSGASTGEREEKELRDDDKSRYQGKGVLGAVSNVNKVIGPALVGLDAKDQEKIDHKMCSLDGTKTKERLGANAILSVSFAVAKAEAISEELELFEYLAMLYGNKRKKFKLPVPMFNILNGGKHARNMIDIQETMIVPVNIRGFKRRLRAGSEIYHVLGNILSNEGYEVGLGDEGGYAPELEKNEEVFAKVKEAVTQAGYTEKEVRIAIDLAASELFKGGKYFLKKEEESFSSSQLIDLLASWVKKWRLLSVEDGLSEDDESWKELTSKISPALSIGDDFFTTNPERIELGAKEKMATGVIIKPNQIGTVTETLEAVRKAKEGGLAVVVSHRSGETEESFIADLAVAVEAEYIKSGAPARSERLAKYNRLCKIEDELKTKGNERR